MLSLDDLFGAHRVMVILRGMPSPGAAVDAAQRAWDAGVELLEVPIGQPGDIEALTAVVDAARDRGKVVGAGTIITTDRVEAAHAAGARYTVAPGFDPAVMAHSHGVGLPHLPGAATPSEVQQAWSAGCRWVKVFPASILGPTWFSAIRGPFPDVNYLATGGVSLETASRYVAAGASVVAFGASAVTAERTSDLTRLIDATRSYGETEANEYL